MTACKPGKASVWIVDIECPYCGGDRVADSETGSCMIEWYSTSRLVCTDCGKDCRRPKKVTA